MNKRSWYARLLQLHHINVNGYLSLVLFEGSIAVAVLLACAETMSVWVVVAVPVTVAVMVKYHDVIIGVLARPAAAAQLRPPQPRVAVGRSPVPRPSRLTTWIVVDDAVRYAPAPGDVTGAVPRGVASVPAEATARRPAPRVRREETPVAVSTAPAAETEMDPDGDDHATGARTYNTAAMRMRGNQGRFG